METLRYRAKYLVTVLISLIIFSILWFVSSSSVLAAVDFTVYDDSLTSGWIDYSWGAIINFGNSSPVQSGSASIATTVNDTLWGGLYLHTDTALDSSGYTGVRFWIHGGSVGGQQIHFKIIDESNSNWDPYVSIIPTANTWTQVTVLLSEVNNPSTIGGLVWQDGTGGFQPTFYVDNIVLVGNGEPTPTPGPGYDGSKTITATGTVLNRYASTTAISGNTISVSNISLLNDGADHYANNALSVGDMILIFQAQGASFTDTSNSENWGSFSYNSAGQYEFAVVVSISGNDIAVESSNSPPYSCGGISNTYDTTNGNVQVVRVPQYTDLTILSGGSVVANDWDGTAGGIVALVVQGSTVINGAVDVSGQGFRGAAVHQGGDILNQAGFRSTISTLGADKGEGILGFGTAYNVSFGRYMRGAPANGGGGGNAHNAAGGGGANGNNGGSWNGAGFVSTSDTYAQAWDLDDGTNTGGTVPAYFQGGAGGGRGGYSWSIGNQNALVLGPDNAAWNGDSRRQVGGLGGRPLDNNPSTHVFFGGGGGAGHMNNSNGFPGGDGGGLIILATGDLSGSGQMIANGDTAASITAVGGTGFEKDGPSGGGAGGSIVIQAGSVSGVTITANGGNGGGQTASTTEAEGSGGGGGGGYIVVDANSGALTTSVLGGSSGLTLSSDMTEFPPNGGTAGYAGETSTSTFSFPGCESPTSIDLVSFEKHPESQTLFIVVGTLLFAIVGIMFFCSSKEMFNL